MHGFLIKGIPAFLLAFFSAAVITWYFIPKIIKLVRERNLGDKPVRHKIHSGSVPTMGGIAIFAGFSVGFLISVNGFVPGISYFTAAVMLLFFVGLTDDLLYLRPNKKLMAEIFSVLLIVLFTNLRFTSLQGFLGIAEIPSWISYLLTVFIVIVIINAVNLVDGIDGLASSIGIIACVTFGTWFFFSGEYGYTTLAAAMTGSLLVFMKFNVSSGRNKIFMGDSGSLILGFTLAIFAVHFNELNLTGKAVYHLNSAPSVSIAILIIPLFDTIRVVVLRLRDHQHPFTADNRHMHHMMLRAGFSHIKATFIISMFNIVVIAVAFMLDHIGILYLGFVILMLCLLFMEVIMFLIKRNLPEEERNKPQSYVRLNRPQAVKIRKPLTELKSAEDISLKPDSNRKGA
jgi:UDP-N-acetylmuramyl pentapeptide phosphotransferase/UDP-N-acetylglucosamine-1-phosphate transferase